MERFFLDNLWPGLAVWVALYISDYILTLTCARLYHAGVKNTIVFEGSFEITPYFQRDIDALRRVSPRFLAALLLIALLLSLLWWVARLLAVPEAYEVALGTFISLQLAIHTRHLRNLFLFRAIMAGKGVRGRLEHPRRPMLYLSSIELLTFSGLFFVIFLFTGSWFVLGGVSGCLIVGAKHRALSRKHASKSPAP